MPGQSSLRPTRPPSCQLAGRGSWGAQQAGGGHRTTSRGTHCAGHSLRSGRVVGTTDLGRKGPGAACPSPPRGPGPPSQSASLAGRALLGDGSAAITQPRFCLLGGGPGRLGLLPTSAAVTEASVGLLPQPRAQIKPGARRTSPHTPAASRDTEGGHPALPSAPTLGAAVLPDR